MIIYQRSITEPFLCFQELKAFFHFYNGVCLSDGKPWWNKSRWNDFLSFVTKEYVHTCSPAVSGVSHTNSSALDPETEVDLFKTFSALYRGKIRRQPFFGDNKWMSGKFDPFLISFSRHPHSLNLDTLKLVFHASAILLNYFQTCTAASP